MSECGGSVAYDTDGRVVRRYGCEVHLFDQGSCPWEDARQAEYAEQPQREWEGLS